MKKFYKGVILNFRYTVLYWLLAHFLWMILMVAIGINMNKMEFIEYVWMLKYDSALGIGIYTGFVAMSIAIFLRFVEIVEVANLKEYALRVNNIKKIKRSSLEAIMTVVLLYTIFLFLVSSSFTFLLATGNADWFRICLTALLYFLFFSCTAMFSYATTGNVGYFLFILLHLNNVFAFLPWLSVPHILLIARTSDIYIAAGIYSLSCILIYAFGSGKNVLKKG